MNKMLTEVRSMRGRQEHLDSRLGAMKRENEALWRELAMLRQKHLKQQQIVNKLIHFLVTLVQPSRNGGLSVKRRYPLMIDDSSRQRNKQAKLSKVIIYIPYICHNFLFCIFNYFCIFSHKHLPQDLLFMSLMHQNQI